MSFQQSSRDQSAIQPPLAIVGISAIFPKAATTTEFWSNIRRGVDAITEVPSSHWNPDDYFDQNQKTPDMTYARRGGFLSPLPFDPLEFGISPNNLEAIDTSQLLGLVGAKRALEDAGYGSDRTFDRSRVGCILGVTGTLEMVIPLGARLGHPRWRKALKDAGVADDVADDVVERISQSYVPWQENSFPGLLGNVVAGRIANRLDLHGTNCVVDAACASSLSAIHLAALELWTGRSDMVVTGGIDTFNDIFMFMCFSKTPALSPSGDAKPFSDEADGTILGEGVGMLVLKRLADAERDGDRVYAVLKGIGTSSDGAGSAVYAPKADGQIRCLKDAYRVSGVSPDTVELVEAHGTGTKVGDATEVSGLLDVYKSTGRQGAWCAIGSVKSQIGHTKAAAGAAGVLKAVLALRHRVLPPTIKVNRPPTALLAADSPFYVNTEARPWLKPSDYPRRAAVSAFGFGGSNFHCVLEEAPQSEPAIDWDGDVQVLALSAMTLPELIEGVRSRFSRLDSSNWQRIRGVASRSRQDFRVTQTHRLLLVVERDKTDIPAACANALKMFDHAADKPNWATPDGAYYGSGHISGKLGVLFPGQGSQYVGMLRELMCRFPVMLDVLSEANDVFANSVASSESPRTDERLSDLIYPHSSFSAEVRSQRESALRATQIAQPAIGAVSLAALAVLDQFGVQPEAAAGHSYGELTALCASHRFGPKALYRLSMLRGSLMAAAQEIDGGMLALGAPLTQIEAALKELSVDLVVANHNSPNQVVLSGRIPEIDRASQLFAGRNIRGKKLAVAAAFHSPLVATASRAFRPILDEIEFAPSRMPVYANSTAAEYPADPIAARDLLATQLAQPVNFVKEVERMHADGVRTFLEVGPGNVLTGLVNSILHGRTFRALAIDSSSGKRSGLYDLAQALAQLASLGHAIRWESWDPAGQPIAGSEDARRMTIPICGANYVKPRPPIPPRTDLPRAERPAPALPTASVAAQIVAEPTPKVTQPAAGIPAAEPPVSPASVDSRPIPLTPKVVEPMKSSGPLLPEPPASIAAAVTTDRPATSTIRQMLDALHKIQTETARLHQQFLEGQEVAFRTFERLAQSQLSQTQMPAPGTTEPQSQTAAPTQSDSIDTRGTDRRNLIAPLPVAHQQHSVTTAPELPRAEKVQSPSQSNAPAVLRPAPLPMTPPKVSAPPATQPIPMVAANQSVRPVTPQPQAQQLPQPASKTAVSTLGATVLAVVSEKTGYPVEMLNLEMSLDHDLGIDSIKRVEILSSLQERVPDLPAFQPDELGSLHSLRDVVSLAESRSETLPKSAEPKLAPVPAPVTASESAIQTGAPSQSVSPQSSSLGSTVLQVVSEKTGYPTEMLNLEMSLDHDLGIDSIKRVEILSALQERVPELPAFQPDELGSLHTLRDVVALADSRTAERAPTEVIPESQNTAPQMASAPALKQALSVPVASAAGTSSLAETVLAVVSEKTGYPAEMLNLEMSLDHDLGIDSIKRVEILSALQERVPELPAFQPEELGALHTLNDVVTLADSRSRDTEDSVQPTVATTASAADSLPLAAMTTVAQPGSAPALPSTGRLGAVVLEVVSEKTGYPTEMLNLEMSLDHDLGIDSIKRVEILSALQERVPGLPAFQPEELGALHTLRDVVTLADRRSADDKMEPPIVEPAKTSPETRPEPGRTAESSSPATFPALGPIVLNVISEKTGYPTEMLNLEMSLDHDLGIDSIKRVEILSALQEQVADLPAFQPEELGALHTIRDVVTLAESRTSFPSSPTDRSVKPAQQASGLSVAPPALQKESEVQTAPQINSLVSAPNRSPAKGSQSFTVSPDVRRSLVQPVPLGPASTRPAIEVISGSAVWITEDGTDFASSVAAELSQRGLVPIIIDLQRSSVIEVPDKLAGIIVVANQDDFSENHLWNAIQLLQKAGPALRHNSQAQSTFVATVSRLDGRFGFESHAPLQNPISGGLAGLAKCAAREWPEIVSRAFDLGRGWSSGQVAAKMFVTELFHKGPVEVGMTPTGFFRLDVVEQRLTGLQLQPALQQGDLLVITGGARGVTAEAAFAAARAWQPRIAILGRSPQPAAEPDWLTRLSTEAEIRQGVIAHAAPGTMPRTIGIQVQQILAAREIADQLHRLSETGIAVSYHSVDVRDAKAVQELLKKLQLDHGPVRGILHGAGVLADQKIEDKTREQFERVYETKVNGLRSLLEAINPRDLKLLGLFSSYTARFGRIGQLDYGIANEVLNKQARQFAAQYPQCRVASFNWGPWDGGMVQGGLKKLFAAEGVGLIPLVDGANTLVQEFGQSTSRPIEVLVLAQPDREPADVHSANGSQPTTGAVASPVLQTSPPSPSWNGQGPSVGVRQRAPEVSTELKIAFERELDLSRYSFLESHVIGGKAVFPVAMMLEWLAHGAIHRNPGLDLQGFDEFRVFQGVRLGMRERPSLKVLIGKPDRQGTTFSIRTQLMSHLNDRDVLHAGGNVILAANYPTPPTPRLSVSGSRYSLNMTEAYEQRLFHGPALRGLVTVERCSEMGIEVTARPAPGPWTWMTEPVRGSWLADPLVIDSALQAIILWSWEQRGKPCLPCAILSYRQYRRAFPKEELRIVIRMHESPAQMVRCDLEILDQNDLLVAQMQACESIADQTLTTVFQQNQLE